MNNMMNLLTRNSVFKDNIVPICKCINELQLNELKETLNENDLDINKVFVVNECFPKYWYIEEPCFIALSNINKEYLQSLNLRKSINISKEHLNKLWNNSDYEQFFKILESRFRFYYFLEKYEDIPNEYKYPIFRLLYTRADYGFNRIESSLIDEIFSLNQDTSFKEKLSTDKDGYIEVYRGEGLMSSSIEKEYSWSVNLKTAMFFGKRNGELRRLYKAKVYIDDIIDYIEDRGEAEVLVTYNKLKNIQEVKLHNLINLLEENSIDDMYSNFNKLINPELFLRPHSIHGMFHAKRVLMLSSIYSFLENLSECEKNILALASVYHDIGRIDDNVCLIHGQLSVAKIHRLNLWKICDIELSEEDKLITEEIIKLHCIDDEEAFYNVMKTTIKDKEKTLRLLKIFKDMDNLDRVRLGDLDIRYLRNDTSLLISDIAYEIYYSNDILDL